MVFAELGATVVTLSDRPTGININDGCGALHPENLAKAVVENGCDVGFALDGDADRLVMVDETGRIVDGDHILALCAPRMHAAGTLGSDAVVSTVMSNFGLEIALRNAGLRLIRTDVGDRHVVEAMRKGGHKLGGEQSGHLVFIDHSTTGDGLLAALQVLAIAVREGKRVSDLAKAMTTVPQVLINLPVKDKPPIATLPSVVKLIAEVERKLAGSGRVLVRYSGTEKKCRVMVEGKDGEQVRKYAEQLVDAVREAIGA
jgi:phosphoglucosamine mutase